MSNRPNEFYRQKTEKEILKDKKNQISRRFSEFFKIMLNPDYYEGTTYGKYFYETNGNGTSSIYVQDPLEDELKIIQESKENTIKYLVGYTGIGKTTLLRNFWKVFDRDIKIENNNIIIYISFYYANLSSFDPQKSIEDEIIRYLKRACRKIEDKWPNIIHRKEDFWKGFYNYIDQHKPTLLENDELTPKSDFFCLDIEIEKNFEFKMEKLEKVCNTKMMEYYSCMLKYLLCFIDEIQNIIFIYDDIEAKDVLYHHHLVETARHIHSCFSVIEDKESQVKTIVALRAYTFRSNIDRQLEARRENIKKNTIRKEEVVNFGDIFQKRFDVIEEIEKKKEKVKSIENYNKAREEFFIIFNQIEKSFGNLIYQLVNYNICNAMILYASIMTNVQWISQSEHEENGGFVISSSNYRLNAETVFRAIACGNEIAYFGENNTFFPNILYNKRDDTELLGLYIIKYLIRNNATNLYGEKYIEGEKILQNIKSLFLERTNSEVLNNIWIERITGVLEFLYDKSILLRSIYDIEDIMEAQIERVYHSSYKLYLSPRGDCLYNLFQNSALLLELYRDDLYTDLENNNKLTYDLSTYEIIKYLLEYIFELFQKEQQYIRNAIHCLDQYQEAFGSDYIVAPLLEGVIKNIRSYYPTRNSESDELMQKAKDIIKSMNTYGDMIEDKYHCKFTVSRYLEEVLLNSYE